MGRLCRRGRSADWRETFRARPADADRTQQLVCPAPRASAARAPSSSLSRWRWSARVASAQPAWARNIRSGLDAAAYYGCIENGRQFAALDGDARVGTHGGSEDHAAILTSRAGWLQQFAFAPLRLERAVPMPDGWTFAVATTGVRARKTGPARASCNRAADALQQVGAAWREQHPADRRPVGQLVRDGEPLFDLPLPEDLRARLQHFIAEDARVPHATAAFERGDVAEIGRLADASQRDAERLARRPGGRRTTELVALARDHGAVAASGFGAGWGGSVWALVDTATAPAFVDRWLRAYRSRHPHLTNRRIRVAAVRRPSPRLTLDTATCDVRRALPGLKTRPTATKCRPPSRGHRNRTTEQRTANSEQRTACLAVARIMPSRGGGIEFCA